MSTRTLSTLEQGPHRAITGQIYSRIKARNRALTYQATIDLDPPTKIYTMWSTRMASPSMTSTSTMGPWVPPWMARRRTCHPTVSAWLTPVARRSTASCSTRETAAARAANWGLGRHTRMWTMHLTSLMGIVRNSSKWGGKTSIAFTARSSIAFHQAMMSRGSPAKRIIPVRKFEIRKISNK